MLYQKQEVMIDYTNYRGERSVRRIRPLSIQFENSEWHPDTQWILHAVDVEKGKTREFAMRDIHSWEPISIASLVESNVR
jgi:predicted DNA-binding transcriptional regulator YafY